MAAVLQLGLAALLTHSWDTFVFQRATTDFLAGGMTPYTVAAQGGGAIYLGNHLPVLQHWYAYPPLPLLLFAATYFPSALGFVEAPWVARVLIKLPAIVATLVLAAAARHLVDTADRPAMAGTMDDARARLGLRVERWFLFNPLFILIAVVWGQLEALVLVFLVLSVLALRSSRWGWGGVCWGLALLVKPFAVFLAPLLVVHLLRRGGSRALRRFFIAGVSFAGFVCLPFFLLEPSGFLRQTVLMHMERPPARFAPLAGLYYAFRWASDAWPASVPDPSAVAAVIGALSLVATLFVLFLWTAAAARRPATEAQLLFWMGAMMLGVLTVSKVLNEQYFLLPLGLLALWFFHPAATGNLRSRVGFFLLAGTWGIFTAGIVERAAFLHFIPPDVTSFAFGRSSSEMVAWLAWSMGLGVEGFILILGVIAVAGVASCLVPGLRVLLPVLREGWATVVRQGSIYLPTATASGRMSVLILVVVLMSGYPVATALLAAPSSNVDPVDESSSEAPLLAVYHTHWYNPTHDPQQAEGSWKDVQPVPTNGYYNPNAYKVKNDLSTLSDAGVDGVLIVVHPVYPQNAATVRRIAQAMELPYAMVLDFRVMEDARTGDAWPGWTQAQVDDLVGGPMFSGWTGPHHMQDPETGRPLLFVRHAGHVQASGSGAHDWDRTADRFSGRGAAQLVFVNTTSPQDAPAGDVAIEAQQDSRGFSWLTGQAFTPSALEQTLEEADGNTTGFVVSWNGFDREFAIEPTREHGDAFLQVIRTRNP